MRYHQRANRAHCSDPVAPPLAPALHQSNGFAPEPEAPDLDDELFLIGERCAQAYLQADQLHYEAMTLLADFDHRRGWQDTGFGSTAEWLAWRIGIKPGAARERLRTARALELLPATSRAMKNGEISFTKARAITRVATADNEAALLELARAGSANNLERVVRAWKRMDRNSEVAAEQARYHSRTFSAFVDDDGMVIVRGRLDPEAGAMLMRAIDASGDALFRAQRYDPSGALVAPEQRRADALGLIAERALSAGFSGDAPVPVSGSRADRTQVVLHVEADTLKAAGDPGQSELADGTRVSAETSRRIACDTGVVRMGHDSDGGILGVGHRTRTVPPSLRRALEARDRGCRFPGCGLRFTDAHHVRHWADGGETELANLVLLCRRHHRAVHEGGTGVCIGKDHRIVFFTPKGRALADAPRYRGNVSQGWGNPRFRRTMPGAPDLAGPQAPLARPVPMRPAGYDGSARWKWDSDVPWAVEARAVDALEETDASP